MKNMQDIGCCTSCRTLQTTLRLSLNGGKDTEIYQQTSTDSSPGERHGLLYVEDASQNHSNSHKGRKPSQKLYMIIPTL